MPISLNTRNNRVIGDPAIPTVGANNVNGTPVEQDVSITTVVDAAGWTTASWPMQLLTGADTLAPSRASEKWVARNKKTSVAEIKKYLLAPRPITVERTVAGVPKRVKVTFLTSERVLEIAAELEKAGGRANKLPRKPAWLRPAAQALLADMQWAAGAPVTRNDVIEWGRKYHLAETPPEGQVLLITNQRVSQVCHHVANHTGEMDALDIVDHLSETSLQFSSMAVQWDQDSGVFNSVRATLFEADLQFRSPFRPADSVFRPYTDLSPSVTAFNGPLKLKRTGRKTPEGFNVMSVLDKNNAPYLHKGQPLWVAGPNLRELRSYFILQRKDGSFVLDPAGNPQLATFDRGHAQANTQFVGRDAMIESFAMENMHAQVPFSNQAVWLNLEDMIRDELLKTPGARAVDVTGVLFAKSRFKPGTAVSPYKVDSQAEDVNGFSPLPENERVWVNGATDPRKPSKDVPVPTHSYKAVLFQIPGTPDNQYQVRCFVVRNDMNLDPQSKPLEVTLKELEKILSDSGQPQTFFEDLPADIRAQVENGGIAGWNHSFVRAAYSGPTPWDDVA